MEKRNGVCSCECAAHKNEIDALRSMVERYREVLEEVALPPYHDSDFASLLETFRTRAKSALSEGGGKGEIPALEDDYSGDPNPYDK